MEKECSYLGMTINQPVQLEIFIIIAERIYQLFSYFQQSHKEEELQNCENGHVFIYFQLELFLDALDVLSTDYSDCEETVSGECHHLSIH